MEDDGTMNDRSDYRSRDKTKSDSIWGKPSSPWKSKGPERKDEEPIEPVADDTIPESQENESPPIEEERPVRTEESPEDVTADWSPRRKNRSASIQFLYAWELNRPDDLCDAIGEFFEDRELRRDDYVYAEELIHGTISNIKEIDELVQEMAENWDFDRIAKIDLTLLRLGMYELLYRPDVPPVVVINEIIDLGKAFSEEKSKRFLNGILDRVLERLDRPPRESSI